jgi:tRNA-binding protein
MTFTADTLPAVQTLRPPITLAEFERVDMRVGRVTEAGDFPRARKPSYLLTIDFGPLGIRRSVAALKADYNLDELRGRHVVCVVNFPPRRIAGFDSEVLVLAATEPNGTLRLLSPVPEALLGSHVT